MEEAVTEGVTPAVVTATAVVPDALLYVWGAAEVNAAVSVSLPTGSRPAGTVTVAVPPDTVAGNEAYVPLLSTTVPEGEAVADVDSATVTVTLCAVVGDEEDAASVTVDAAGPLGAGVGATELEPPPHPDIRSRMKAAASSSFQLTTQFSVHFIDASPCRLWIQPC